MLDLLLYAGKIGYPNEKGANLRGRNFQPVLRRKTGF